MSLYHRPETLNDALSLLQGAEMRVAAGCTDLFPATQARALTGPVVDITNIAGLRGISDADGGYRIGAATTWSDVIKADLPPAFDMLKEAAREVGSVQIQNAGTVAGNLCNASPAADGVPCLLALDATVELASTSGHRMLALSDFITGPRQTALAPDEMVVALHVPQSACSGVSRFRKLGARKYLVISIAMVAARLGVVDGKIETAAIAVGSCSAVAQRLTALGTTLVGQKATPDMLDEVTVARVSAALSPIDDIRADAAYRAEAATELVKRALEDLLQTEALV
ncbi:FAD binding domain-containing protein [Roseovarius rhodophyticola]|uniref:FAD binding domain-containing protein n=1 Tax=Roseovarius rhodophyticola TaxID=3080827 RepID=A0ABZ2THX9_9RHOB|nr:FAD binding domain-containing protein [Roseovarius sp. W115]MDV2929629.1 FAD binding domain-containing protein [Roseovarius sp. W115]